MVNLADNYYYEIHTALNTGESNKALDLYLKHEAEMNPQQKFDLINEAMKPKARETRISPKVLVKLLNRGKAAWVQLHDKAKELVKYDPAYKRSNPNYKIEVNEVNELKTAYYRLFQNGSKLSGELGRTADKLVNFVEGHELKFKTVEPKRLARI